MSADVGCALAVLRLFCCIGVALVAGCVGPISDGFGRFGASMLLHNRTARLVVVGYLLCLHILVWFAIHRLQSCIVARSDLSLELLEDDDAGLDENDLAMPSSAMIGGGGGEAAATAAAGGGGGGAGDPDERFGR